MEPKSSSKARGQFIWWAFVAGTCAPLLWISAGYAVTHWMHWLSSTSGWTTLDSIGVNVLWAITCITFPTRVLFIDTEHLPEFLIMLLVASPLNGAYYALLGLIFWQTRELLRRLIKRLKTA
jgi:hypothetical protein